MSRSITSGRKLLTTRSHPIKDEAGLEEFLELKAIFGYASRGQ